jgi:glucose-1-phosphate adenylyltransferase
VLTNLEFRGIGFAPPALYGKGAAVRESLVSASCVIEGGVERSILSPGVRVGKGAVVRGCILMHDCVVGEGAVLEGVISDRDSRFGAGCRVGAEPCAGTLDAGLGDLTLVGKAVQVADGAVVPRCRQVPHGAVVAAG